MRIHWWLLLGLIACGGDDAADDNVATDTVTPGATTTMAVPVAPPSLDSLIAGLDTAGGKYTSISSSGQLGWRDGKYNRADFRAQGHDAVARLIECLPDQTPTRTTHYENDGVTYPRGLLCLEVLRDLTDVDASRELPMNPSDLSVDLEPRYLADELNRAQAAWRVVYANRAYRFRSR
jgi:hypothetical protein